MWKQEVHVTQILPVQLDQIRKHPLGSATLQTEVLRHPAQSVWTALTVLCVQTITMNCVQHIKDVNGENSLIRGRKIYSARLRSRRAPFNYITAVQMWPELRIQKDTAPSAAIYWSSLVFRSLNIHITWSIPRGQARTQIPQTSRYPNSSTLIAQLSTLHTRYPLQSAGTL
jgi:hypothetical protein